MLQNGNTSNSLHLAPITTLKEAHVDTRRKTFCGTVVTKRPMTVYEMNGNECFRFHFHMNDAGDETVIARIVAFDESAKKWDSYITEGQKYIVSKLNSQPLPDKYKSAELTEDFQLVIERLSCARQRALSRYLMHLRQLLLLHASSLLLSLLLKYPT
uniref:Uncharacterized protein n=1 Tax=Plectus sambesii TaxID=2011161 RepID=A0A914VGN6_9BILA